MPDRTYRGVVGVFRTVFALWGIRFDLRGTEHIPAHGPAVVAVNHVSFLDFAFVGLAARRARRLVRFMAKRGVFRSRLTGPVMRAMRHIPVDRDGGASAYRTAARLLQDGELVGIFPEATISRAWTLKPLKPGAASLAVAEGVPLIPVVTWGGHRILTVDGHRSLRRHIPVTILVGEPIVPGAADSAATVGSELRLRLLQLLDQAQREYPDRPRNVGDGWWQPRHLGGTAPTPRAAAVIDAQKMLG